MGGEFLLCEINQFGIGFLIQLAELRAQHKRIVNLRIVVIAVISIFFILLISYRPYIAWRNAALINAIDAGYDIDEIRILLNSGADPNARRQYAGRSLADRFWAWLGNGQIPPDDDATALARACYGSREDAVKLLLDRGADSNGRYEGGFTPLMASVGGHSAPIMRLLLDRGADPKLHTHAGLSPLSMARASGQGDLINLLLEAGGTE